MKKSEVKKSLRPGAIFKLNLRCDRDDEVIGLVVRWDGDITWLSYFYHVNPKLVRSVADLKSKAPLAKFIHGPMGFMFGGWDIVGNLKSYDQCDWPMPAFFLSLSTSQGQVSDEGILQRWDENTLMYVSSGDEIVKMNAEYGIAGVAGPGFIEKSISKMLQ